MTGPGDQAQTAFSQGYWQVIWRRRAMVGLFALLVTAVASVGSFVMTPVYEATVVLDIREQRTSILGSDLSGSLVPLSSREDINTQIEIIKSRTVLEKVIAELHLDGGPAGAPAVRQREAERQALDRLRRDMTVRQVPNTRLISLSARSTDPDLAARIANAIASVFIDKNVESKRGEANAVLAFVSGQADQVREQLNKTEEDLLAYKKGERIGILDQEARLMVERLAQLEASSQEAQVGLDVLDTRIAAILRASGTNDSALPAGAAEPGAGPVLERLAALQVELAKLEAGKEDRSSQIASIREQVDSLRSEVRSELQTVLGKGSAGALNTAFQMQLAEYESQRVVLKARLDALHGLIRNYEGDINRLPAQEIALVRLERTQRINNELYAALMKAKNEAQVEAASQISNADVIDAAVAPLDPVRPNKQQNVAVALVAGLVVGMLLALVFEALDHTVRTEEEVRRSLDASILGIIPRFKDGAPSPRNGRDHGARAIFFNADGADPSISEAFGMLAANLRLLDAKGEAPALVVTSPAPGDGKTTVAANLALALAAQHARVVLVDADFRKPRLHGVFGLSREPGISDVFLRGAACGDVVRRIDGAAPIDVVTAGPPLAAGTEAAASSSMTAVINELKKSYDRIILDVPPVVGASDAVILASAADAALLVMRLGQLDRRVLKRTGEILANARVRVIGGVLNGVNPRELPYGYHYYYTRRREG